MSKWNPFRKNTPKDETPSQPPATESGQGSGNGSDPPPSPPAPEQPSDSGKPKKVGVLGKFKQALVKTVNVLNTDLRDLVKEGRLVDDAFLEEVFALMIRTDMGVSSASKIRDDIGKKFRARKVEFSDLLASAKETVREIMHQGSADVQFAESGPTVIMVVGVNGAGKTTSIAKLVNRFKEQGKSVVLGAGDTFRAAAVEQLTVWANRLDAEIVTGKSGSDPASVAWQATEAAYNLSLIHI